jgi:glutamine amidotransferase
MIAIIDYTMGNLASVGNALHAIGTRSRVVSDPDDLLSFDKAILPGVGAFGDAMRHLNNSGMADAIRHFVKADGKSVLGICLGMQLLFEESSEFGTHAGLGLVEGRVLSLQEHVSALNVPNTGWCRIERHGRSRLTRGIEDEDLCFYFVHSFFCRAADRQAVTGVLHYGTPCDVIVEQDNVYACQFHPEKSQAPGLSILRNFVEL